MFLQRKLSFIAALAAGALWAMPDASAASILIDFGDNIAGDLDPDSMGRYWNTLDGTDATTVGVVLTDAIDQDNNATTVDLRVTVALVGDFTSTGVTATLTDWDAAVVDDSWYTNIAGSAIRLEGLTAEADYTLVFYGTLFTTQPQRGLRVTIGAEIQEANYVAGTDSAPGEILFTFDATSDASGQITAVIEKPTGGFFGYVGGLEVTEVTAVPEPASIVLIGLGGLAILVGWRRRV